jgi:methionyl-tRNA formyltransferase
MQLEEGLDTGPVFARAAVAIGPEETAEELRQRLGQTGTELLLGALAAGFPEPAPQVGEPTYAAKLEPDELRIDFAQPAEITHRVVRVGRAWTTWREKRLLVLRARLAGSAPTLSPGQIAGNIVGTGDGNLELIVVQPEGKAPMDAKAWARGARPQPGDRLGG